MQSSIVVKPRMNSKDHMFRSTHIRLCHGKSNIREDLKYLGDTAFENCIVSMTIGDISLVSRHSNAKLFKDMRSSTLAARNTSSLSDEENQTVMSELEDNVT